MGFLATRAVYGSAGVFVPTMRRTCHSWIFIALFVAVMFAGFWIAGALNVSLVEPAIFLGLIGVVSILLGLTGYGSVDRTERILRLAGGSLLLLLSVAPAPFLPSRDAAYAVYGSIAPLATAIVYFGIGLFLTQRG
jgi:hypothetical protein